MSLTKIKVLIVDDEPIGRQLLQAVLLPEGFEIYLAEDGEKAIQVAQQFQPQIILMDIMMPVMDGYQTVKNLKKIDSLKNIPVIMVTALEDRDSRIKGLEVGAIDYITKPFDRIEIITKIKNRTQNLLSENRKNGEPDQQPQNNHAILETFEKEISVKDVIKNYSSGKIAFEISEDSKVPNVGGWTRKNGDTEYLCFFGTYKPLPSHTLLKVLIINWMCKLPQKDSISPSHMASYIFSKMKSSNHFDLDNNLWWFLVFKSMKNEILASGFNQSFFRISKENSSENEKPLFLINCDKDKTIAIKREDVIVVLSKGIISNLNNNAPLIGAEEQPFSFSPPSIQMPLKSLIEKAGSEGEFGVRIKFQPEEF